MRLLKGRCFVFASRCVSFLSLALLCGCAATWDRSHTILNENRIVVEVEQLTYRGEPKDAGFAHPATVSPEGLRAFFLNLKYRRQTPFFKSTDEPAVSNTETIDKLSLALSEGLRMCSPAQRVRFLAVNMHTKIALFPVAKKTRGVAFVQPEGTLNIAFDLVDDEPGADQSDELFFKEWDDPTRYAISTYELILRPGISSYRSPTGHEHPLWVVIPLALITPKGKEEAQPPAVAKEIQGATEDQKGEGTKKPEPKELGDEERMHRLRYLQELYEKKVINEEEYRREWKKIFREY